MKYHGITFILGIGILRVKMFANYFGSKFQIILKVLI
jgi:hypothetical protein